MSMRGSAAVGLALTARPAAPPLRVPPRLTAEQQRRLDALARQLSRAGDEGQFGEAARRAGQKAALLEKCLGKQHWQSIDAGYEWEQWQRFARMPARLRGEAEAKPVVKGKAAKLPEGERPFAHPHYWAALVLVGDPA